MLTLLDFKKPGIDDILIDLMGDEKYASAHDILVKARNDTEEELNRESESASILVAILAEYLRSDAQSASMGTVSYLYNLKVQIKTQPLSELTVFDLMMYQEMIENIDKMAVACIP